MGKQVIITIGRTSGSGGLEIAEKLSQRLGILLYDKNIFEEIEKKYDVDTSRMKKYDEKFRKLGVTRHVNGYSNSPEEQVVELQRKFIKGVADEGQSFIIMGRCGIRAVLDHPCTLIRVFVDADRDFRVQRVMADEQVDEHKAAKHMDWVDLKRRHYHDQFCSVKWGDPTSYDIMLKSNKLGIDGTVDLLEQYVRMRTAE